MEASQVIFERGDLDISLAFASLFTPSFIEAEGNIFLAEFCPRPANWRDRLAADLEGFAGNTERIKAFVDSLYWLEVPSLFMNPAGAEEDYRRLAVAIAASWNARLRQQYPEHRFRARVLEPEETGSTIGVGFEQLG